MSSLRARLKRLERTFESMAGSAHFEIFKRSMTLLVAVAEKGEATPDDHAALDKVRAEIALLKKTYNPVRDGALLAITEALLPEHTVYLEEHTERLDPVWGIAGKSIADT